MVSCKTLILTIGQIWDAISPTDFIHGINVQHHKEFLMTKVMVTLAKNRSRSNVPKILCFVISNLECYLTHRIHTLYQCLMITIPYTH